MQLRGEQKLHAQPSRYRGMPASLQLPFLSPPFSRTAGKDRVLNGFGDQACLQVSKATGQFPFLSPPFS